MNFSQSEENYLKTIFHLQVDDEAVTTNAVAEKLHTRPASVTDMMKKLNAKKLLHYKPYYGFYLSAEGKKIALTIIRRHRLWEFFLAEKLQFSWQEVHEVAEELEHVRSKKLIDKLDEYLGFPQFDPHGDPIPDSKGKISTQENIRLTELILHTPAKICNVVDQSKNLLEELALKKISIGIKLEIKKRSEFDQSIEVKIRNQLVTITEQLARHLFVIKL